MKQKYYLIIGILAVLGIILLVGYTAKYHTNACERLAKKLDKTIIDTNNPPGRFSIDEYEGIVGGTLTNIKNNGPDHGYNSYILTFRGVHSEGDLYLITSSKLELPYKTGQFYKFDLANINQYSAALSGSFIDNKLDKLIPVSCPLRPTPSNHKDLISSALRLNFQSVDIRMKTSIRFRLPHQSWMGSLRRNRAAEQA